jgi:CRISPR-associated endonuclease/helicase Cas3
MGEMPTFGEFYGALWDREPFPWQARLAHELANGSRWPREIGVPTGLGKTSCLEIAIWWLASQADLPAMERSAPTRIWWVVNRRLLVDATWQHAEHIAARLASAADSGSPLGEVAERLRVVSGGTSTTPLEVIRLRGGASTDRPSSPAQPAVILSTVPMFGSRLLFRGYGVSRSMRPVDAALAGTDSLVLIDEAHLAESLRGLFGPIAECEHSVVPVLPPARSRPQVVSLTATGDAPEGQRFELGHEPPFDDYSHPVVAQRLHARKPMVLVDPGTVDPARALADQCIAVLGEAAAPLAVVVFANTPRTARETFERLRKSSSSGPKLDLDLILLTGRVREPDAERLRRTVLDETQGAPAGRPMGGRDRHFVVVATQTLEVGADLDFELLITEACGVRALTQRLGRLNRLGWFPHARAYYLHTQPRERRSARAATDQASAWWPVYGSEPSTVWDRLCAAADEAGVVEVSPATVAGVLGEPMDAPSRAPEVLPALVDEWVKTTIPPPGEAPVEPFFSGIAERNVTVEVCWRAFVPEGGKLWPRPRAHETIGVPVGELREALDGVDVVVRLTSDRVTCETVRVVDLRPGDVVVLPLEAGLNDEYGWNPQSREAVSDLSLAGVGLPLDAGALRRLVPGLSLDEAVVRDVVTLADDEEESDRLERVEHLLVELRRAAEEADRTLVHGQTFAEFLDSLATWVVEPPGEVPRLVVQERAIEPVDDEQDELSLAAQVPSLRDHGMQVGEQAAVFARALGLASEIVEAIRVAGEFHDLGKVDARFQAWLDPGGRSTEPVAKSDRPRARWESDRRASGWPKGGRHEVLSARLATAWFAKRPDTTIDAELVVHLVVSHHGHGRPFVLPAADEWESSVVAEIDGVTVTASANLATPDWDQPTRFARLNHRYGRWAVALAEAIVRQADHLVSAASGRLTKEIL